MAPYSLRIIIHVTVSTYWFINTWFALLFKCGAILCSFWKCGRAMKCSVGPRTSLPKLKENYKKHKKKTWGQRRSKTVRTTWSVEEERAPSPPPSLTYAAGLITWQAAPERRGGENTKGGACQSASNVYEAAECSSFLLFQFEMEMKFSIPSGTVFDSSDVLFLKEKVRTWERKTNFRRNQKPFSKGKNGWSTSFKVEGLETWHGESPGLD